MPFFHLSLYAFFYGILAAFGSLITLAFFSVIAPHSESTLAFLFVAVGIEECFKGLLSFRLPLISYMSIYTRLWLVGAMFGIGFFVVEYFLLLGDERITLQTLPLLLPVLTIHILTSILWVSAWDNIRNKKNAFLPYFFIFLAFFFHAIYNSFVAVQFFPFQ